MASTLNKKFELMGIHVGDGCISVNNRYAEYALLGDMREEKEYHETHVIPLFNEIITIPLLNKKVVGKSYPSNGVFGFHIFEPKIVEYFTKLGFKAGPKTNIELPKIITAAKKEHQKAFLRGLFDTDGTVYFEKNYSKNTIKHERPKIKIATTSETLKNQIKQMCKNLGITAMEKRPYKGKRDKNEMHSLVIYRKSDVEKWFRDVGFNNTKHRTKIELWKKLGHCPPKTTIEQRKTMLREIDAMPCQT